MEEKSIQDPRSLTSTTPNNSSNTKPEEHKVRVDEDKSSDLGQTKKEQKNSWPFSASTQEPALDIKETKSRPITGTSGMKFPALQAALKSYYGAQGTLQLPLSGQRFPIKDVSLTISDKSEQDRREKERRLTEEKEKKGFLKKENDEKEAKGGKKDKSDTFWSSRFRLEEEWHRIGNPIAAKDIFTIEDSKTPIRRVLIEGRAGVGKTTFSQYVAHQWVEQQLFASQFDYLFWLPLRQCLSSDSPRYSSMEAHVAAFIYERQMNERTGVSQQDIETILNAGENSRALLILDGFDEVAGQLSNSYQPFNRILDKLLRFSNLIITTRDYQTPPPQYKFDRCLVNVGFTDAQISDYIQNYCAFSRAPIPISDKDENKYETSTAETKSTLSATPVATEQAQRIEAALKQNPRFWGLSHIPLNLALICESWSSLQYPTLAPKSTSSLPTKVMADQKETGTHTLVGGSPTGDSKIVSTSTTSSTKLSMTALYQNVLLSFLKRDIQKYPSSSTPLTWEALSESYALELLSLGAIAWQGMQAQPQILGAALDLMVSDYPEVGKGALESAFIQGLNLGLLRHDSGEKTKPLLERRYYFIHLTFQEYFAAYYVLQTLQGRAGKSAYQEMQNWLAQHKYEPRYAILLHFLAGLTTQSGYDQALQVFWRTLLSPPYDVVGAQHLQLMVRCLSEARSDDRIPGLGSLLTEIRQWLDGILLMRLSEERSVAMAWLSALFKQEPKLLRLSSCMLPPTVLKAVDNKDKNVREKAIRALARLGEQLIAYPDALVAVLKAASDEHKDVRQAAQAVLDKLGEKLDAHPEVLSAVLKAASDEHKDVRQAALAVLDKLGEKLAAHPEALSAVVKAASDRVWYVRQAAIEALSKLGEKLAAHPEALSAVLKAADDQEMNVRVVALTALSMPAYPKALPTVLKAMSDKDEYVRRVGIAALSKLDEKLDAHSEALSAMFKAVGDQDKDARRAAIDALGKLGEKLAAHPEALSAVLKAVGDQDKDARRAAIDALGKLGEKLAAHPEALSAVLKAVGDQEKDVRRAALKALGKLGEKLAADPQALSVVLKATDDQDPIIRWAAREEALGVLGEKLAAHREALSAVLKAVGDQKPHIRRAAINALGKLGEKLAAHREALSAVLKATGDQESDVREAAREALGKLGEKLAAHPAALSAVLKAADDPNQDVRRAAIKALGKLGEKLAEQPEALSAMLKAAGDPERDIQEEAIGALGKLSEKLAAHPRALSAVLKTADNQAQDIRWAAICALGKLGKTLAAQPEALSTLLIAMGDQGKNVRWAAICALGKLGEKLAAHPEALSAVLKATSDQDMNVRWGAKEALGKLDEELAEHQEALSAVLKAVGDQEPNIRRAAIDALGKLGEKLATHPEALSAVLKATGDQESDVRGGAREALGKLGENWLHTRKSCPPCSKPRAI